MGDGWIGTSGRCLQAEWSNKEYAKYVSDELGWVCGDINERTNREGVYQISTVSCEYIEETFEPWRKSGEKRWDIRRDLTPTALQHLYACDGSLKVREKRRPAATIGIENESDRAVEIAEWIHESGFPKPSVHSSQSGTSLYFGADDTPELLSEFEPVPGYEYKWTFEK